MNALESQLDYCLGTAVPEPGRAVEVAPGVRWVRMSLPFALNHINLWLLRDRVAGRGGEPAREGWTIVDCGIDNAATRAAWEERVRDRARRPAGAARHRHPHAPRPHRLRRTGCASAGTRASGSAPPTSASPGMASSASAGFGGPLSAAFMAQHGMAADPDGGRRRRRAHQLLPEPGAGGAGVVPAPARRRHASRSAAAPARADWTCHVGYGHAPEHMALALRVGAAS